LLAMTFSPAGAEPAGRISSGRAADS